MLSPQGNYLMGWGAGFAGDRKSLKKLWSQAKIPSFFLTPYFPLIQDEKGNLYEFLTGKRGCTERRGALLENYVDLSLQGS